MERTLSALGYRPGLDGLRGLAIACVVAFHAGLTEWEFLGATGVTIFFVLSGFLITRLLLEERELTRRVNLLAFYGRRARRLLPALLLMLAVITVIMPAAWTNALWALSYAANWAKVGAVELSPYGHTWSLAIEEQFYLLWPLAFLLLGMWSMRLALIALVACLAGRFALPYYGWEFFAFSTPMQAPSLLVGVVLAFVRWERVTWPWLFALLGAAGLIVATALPSASTAELSNRIRDPLAAVASALLLVACYQGWLAWRPLMALGRISYGVYLWHTPIFLLIGATLGAGGWLLSLTAVLATLAAASTSYLVLERPILQRRWPTIRRPGMPRMTSRPQTPAP